MKVLHINYTDKGGAFIALKRIDESLKLNFEHQYHSSLLIINPTVGNNSNYVTPIKSSWDKFINFIRPRAVRVFTQFLFSPNGNGTESYNVLRSNKIISFINNSDFDLVHLHWIGGETISIKDFRRIKKPIVWTLHDSWAYLGRNHLQTIEQINRKDTFIDNYLKSLKRKIWKDMNMEIICVSNWLKKEVNNSNFFLGNNVIRIFNSINTISWKPIQIDLARNLLNLSHEKTYLCLGAVNPTSDINKGFLLLKEAVKIIPDEFRSNIEILMFGASGDEIILSGVKTTLMGEITDELVLKILYAASDVILIPSYLESFGQTALEAIAMEKPVVCFDSSGTTDVVNHLQNGYVANSYSSEDFARGILWAIKNGKALEVKQNAREYACNVFDYKVISKQYFDVYSSKLDKFKNS